MMGERDNEATRKLAKRLHREFRPYTEHGGQVILENYEADTLAEIIAEYVEAVARPLPDEVRE